MTNTLMEPSNAMNSTTKSAKAPVPQASNPFRIFDNKVERRFLIRSRDYSKYTEEQLREQVLHSLRTFMIDNELCFLAKDTCSFLGITPEHISQSVSKIDQGYVRRATVTLQTNLEQVASSTSKRTSKFTGEVCLLTEPGVYALIQHAHTVYAQDFKRWLNEDVLPKVRATGGYAMPAEMKADLDDINDNYEQAAFGAELMDPAEQIRAFEAIVAEKDEVIQKQQELLASKDTTLNGLMDFLHEMKAATERSFSELKADNARTRSELHQVRAKLDTVLPDRVIKTEDAGIHPVFSLYQTGENDIPNKRYPYCLIRCQHKRLEDNERRMRVRYPAAALIYTLSNPNAESLFQVFKERARSDNLGIVFKNTSFYIDEARGPMSADDIVSLIRDIERERTAL